MTEMDCRKIELLISPYIDQQLTRAEADMVRMHLSACADCQQEFEEMARLSAVMQSLNQVVVPAPPGFSAAVMQRIREEDQVVPLTRQTGWLNRNWKRLAAGAAAAAMLLAGPLLNNAGHLAPLVQIADNPPSWIQPHNPVPGEDPQVNDPGNDPGYDPGSSPGTNPVNPNGDTTSDPNSVPNDGEPVTPPDDGPVQIAENPDPAEYSPMVFLAKERFLVTTLLEVRAGDADRAQQQALSLSGQYQAQVQNLGQQVNANGRHTVLKITIGKSQAGKLMASLEGLGLVMDREITRTDINSQFGGKLSQYQSLVAQRNSEKDPDDVATLETRLAALENELNNWDTQADQETIILWLLR